MKYSLVKLAHSHYVISSETGEYIRRVPKLNPNLISFLSCREVHPVFKNKEIVPLTSGELEMQTFVSEYC